MSPKHNYQPTGWVQGSGFVGQHPIGAVASLFSPLIIVHGPSCLLSRRTSRFDDQRGRLEKSRHPGLNILVSVRIPFKIEFLSWWSCHEQVEEKGNTFSWPGTTRAPSPLLLFSRAHNHQSLEPRAPQTANNAQEAKPCTGMAPSKRRQVEVAKDFVGETIFYVCLRGTCCKEI